jgi:hypothetical protein
MAAEWLEQRFDSDHSHAYPNRPVTDSSQNLKSGDHIASGEAKCDSPPDTDKIMRAPPRVKRRTKQFAASLIWVLFARR